MVDADTATPIGITPSQSARSTLASGVPVGEFCVSTGRQVGFLARTPDPDTAITAQVFWWDGHDTLTGTIDGPVFIVRGGTKQAIPWDSRISGPQGRPGGSRLVTEPVAARAR